jgi:hypothetical protein
MKKILLPMFLILAAPASQAPAGNFFGSGPWANGMYYPGQLDGRYFANVYNNLGGTFTRVSTTNSFFATNQVTTSVVTNVGLVFVTNTVTTNTVTGPLLETNTVVTGSVVSGVVGFGIRDGTPAFVNASTVAVGATGVSGTANSSSALQSLSLDRSLNNFVVYINGDAYVGTTTANINPKTSTVSGVLANGAGRTLFQLFTNQATGGGSGVANVGVEVISLPSATASGYFNANVNNNKTPYTFSGSGTIAIASASGSISAVDGTHNFNLDGIKTSGNSASAFPQTSAAVNPQQ